MSKQLDMDNPGKNPQKSFTYTLIHVLTYSLALVSAAAADTEVHFQKRQLEPRFFCEGANVGDFNKDGKVDVVAGPFWYAGPELETRHAIYPPMPSPPKGYSHNFLTFVYDLNGDGWDDVVQCDFPGQKVRWYENRQRDPGHWQQHPVVAIADGESPTLTDLTGDGRPELVTAQSGYFGYATPPLAGPG